MFSSPSWPKSEDKPSQNSTMWMEAPEHRRPEHAGQAAEQRRITLTRLQARQMSQCPPISLTRSRPIPDLIKVTDRSPVLPPPQPEFHAPKHHDSGPGYPPEFEAQPPQGPDGYQGQSSVNTDPAPRKSGKEVPHLKRPCPQSFTSPQDRNQHLPKKKKKKSRKRLSDNPHVLNHSEHQIRKAREFSRHCRQLREECGPLLQTVSFYSQAMAEQNVFLRLEYHRLLHTLQRFHYGNRSTQSFPTQRSAGGALSSHHATDPPPPLRGQPHPPFFPAKGGPTPATPDTRFPPPVTQHAPFTMAQAPTKPTKSGGSTCLCCHLKHENVTPLKQEAKEPEECAQFH